MTLKLQLSATSARIPALNFQFLTLTPSSLLNSFNDGWKASGDHQPTLEWGYRDTMCIRRPKLWPGNAVLKRSYGTGILVFFSKLHKLHKEQVLTWHITSPNALARPYPRLRHHAPAAVKKIADRGAWILCTNEFLSHVFVLCGSVAARASESETSSF